MKMIDVVDYDGAGATISFDTQEIYALEIEANQNYTLKRLQDGIPVIYLSGRKYDSGIITVRAKAGDVAIGKLETLYRNRANKATLICYDCLGQVVENLRVQFVTDFNSYFAHGLRDGSRNPSLNFIRVAIDRIAVTEF